MVSSTSSVGKTGPPHAKEWSWTFTSWTRKKRGGGEAYEKQMNYYESSLGQNLVHSLHKITYQGQVQMLKFSAQILVENLK